MIRTMIAVAALTALPLAAVAEPQQVQQQNPDQPPHVPGIILNAKGQPVGAQSPQQPAQQQQPQQTDQQQTNASGQSALPANTGTNTVTAPMRTSLRPAAKTHKHTAVARRTMNKKKATTAHQTGTH